MAGILIVDQIQNSSNTLLINSGALASGVVGTAQIQANVAIANTTLTTPYITNAVGIGTQSPAANIHINATMASNAVYQTELILQAQPATGATGSTSTGGVQLVFQGTTDGAVPNSTLAAIAGYVDTAQVNNSGGLLFRAQQSAGSGLVNVVRINQQNIQMQQSGGGIIFNNSSASTNSTLNDYETGTFTPNFTAAGTLGSYTSSGYYTKIGRMVNVQAIVTISSVGSATAAVSIGNLPFTAGGSSPLVFAGVLRENGQTGNSYFGYLAATSTLTNLVSVSGGSVPIASSYQYELNIMYYATF
jgi:hypothetical protein